MVQDPEARHGYNEKWLKREYPLTYRYLLGFRSVLESRAAYKKYHAEGGHPFYSMFNISEDTFAPYKVAWRRMGNDICLAWPVAELAVMGAKGAVEILHRRSTPEERVTAEAEYSATLLTPWVAAERGYVDDVIRPDETRRKVAAAFELLNSKREALAPRAHENSPL